jgi:hypothetical protein
MAPKPRSAPPEVPDSLPPRHEGTDVLPDDARRTDAPATVPPDSLPPSEDERTADGGTMEHPIHDADVEDYDGEDYEHAIDEVEQTGGINGERV